MESPFPLQSIELLEHISDGFLALDTQMECTYVNRRGARLLGCKTKDLIGRSYWQLFPEAAGTPFAEACVRALETQQPATVEHASAPGERWFENRIHPSREGLSIFFTDITERKLAEQALSESEQRLQLLTESIPDMIWSARPDGVSDYYNQRFLEYLGKTLDEMQGWTWVDALHPQDRERSLAVWLEAVRQGGPYETEYRMRRASDGQYRWHLSRAAALRDGAGKIVRWYGTHTDVDELKRAQEQLRETTERLELLSRRQLQLQETERRTIARELHDQIGQMLTALNLTLEMSTQLPPEGSRRKMEQARGIVDELMARVSSLSLQLRPPVLDDLGLLPALVWHITRYEEQSGIVVDLHHSGLKGRRFDSQIETTTYRIVQEALTNVARHARDAHVRLEVRARPGFLSLTVEDDGQGFSPKHALAGKHSSGLSGMQERVGLLGGTFQIDSRSGQGTRLSVQLPLEDKRV
jgi:PAS domain S-box-containing protein